MSRTENAGVVIERTYRASLEEMWSLWTTKDGFESWWGPDGFRSEVHTLEAREGGLLHYSMIAATPEMVAVMQKMGRPATSECRSHFTELKPRTRLTLTNVIDFLPGVPSYEAAIVAEFFPAGDSVRMVITLSRMHDAQFTKMQQMGMASQLTKLDRRFGAAEANG